MKEDILEPDVYESWTHGAMLGGMVGYEEQALADSYFLAGDMLVGAVLERGADGRDMINPVMCVYRHGVELYLKCIVRLAERNHNLGSLLEEFCRLVRGRYKERVPPWITKPISEFAMYDPASDAFRHKDSTSQRLQQAGEF